MPAYFAGSASRHAVTQKNSASGDKDSTDAEQQPATLAIDVTETKKRKSKKRLTHSGDFACLLDALIYHLRLQLDKPAEELDQFGRTEEEQIGADDEEDKDTHQMTEQRKVELLEFCHSKVRTVVNRMITQLQAYTSKKQSLRDVLIRLLGVLAVLRELRGCDGRVQWVGKGETTVPAEERLRLLEETMLTLFEGKASLLHLESLGEEFMHCDDVARLKGLMVWLAWDCGLSLDMHKPFMEDPQQLAERLRRNAMMLALAQAIEEDEVVIDEVRQSIGSLSTSEMDWLKNLQVLASRCDAVKRGDSEFHLPEEANPGDVALHKTLKNWDLRIVEKSSAQFVTLIKLGKDKNTASYQTEYLKMAKLTAQ